MAEDFLQTAVIKYAYPILFVKVTAYFYMRKIIVYDKETPVRSGQQKAIHLKIGFFFIFFISQLETYFKLNFNMDVGL